MNLSNNEMKSGCSGHTLVELLVVLGVMSMAAGTATFAYVKRSPAYRMDQAALQIANTLRLARSQAVQENLDAQFTMNTSTGALSVWIDRNEDGSVDSDERNSVVIDDFEDLSMWVYPTPSGSFDSRGDYFNEYAYGVHLIYLCSSQYEYRQIFVFQNGQIDIQDY